jgi:hypothetical protein
MYADLGNLDDRTAICCTIMAYRGTSLRDRVGQLSMITPFDGMVLTPRAGSSVARFGRRSSSANGSHYR